MVKKKATKVARASVIKKTGGRTANRKTKKGYSGHAGLGTNAGRIANRKAGAKSFISPLDGKDSFRK